MVKPYFLPGDERDSPSFPGSTHHNSPRGRPPVHAVWVGYWRSQAEGLRLSRSMAMRRSPTSVPLHYSPQFSTRQNKGCISDWRRRESHPRRIPTVRRQHARACQPHVATGCVHRFVDSLRLTACPGCFRSGLRLDQVICRRPCLADWRRHLVVGQLKHVVGTD
jgi:hypothetical protein